MTLPVILLGLCGIAFSAYGFLIFSVRSGTLFALVWFAFAIACFLGAWLAMTGRWGELPDAVRRIVLVLIGVFFVWLVLTQAFILTDFGGAYDPSRPSEDDPDCIIVLGAQVRPGGPSIVLQNRLDTAYDYLVAHPDAYCIVSGGQGPNEPWTEAAGMADYLGMRGIDASRIIQEDRSSNTVENIRYCMELLDSADEPVGIVTNNFHLHRSDAIARKQGLTNILDIAAPSNPVFLPNNLLRESAGLTKDLLEGNL